MDTKILGSDAFFQNRFLVAHQLNTYFSVFVFYMNIQGQREISYQEVRTDTQQTNTQMLEIKDMSYTYEGQL